MKRLSLLLFIVGLIFIYSQNSNAQESKKKKEAKIKVHIKKDGEFIQFDTLIQDFKNHKELVKIFNSKNVPDSLFKFIETDDFIEISNDKEDKGKRKIIVKTFQDSDAKLQSEIKKKIKVISDGSEKIIISADDDEQKSITLESLDENIQIKKINGKKIYIIKEDIGLDTFSDKDMETITIESNSDHDADIEIELEITEDAKSIKKIKRKNKKSKKENK